VSGRLLRVTVFVGVIGGPGSGKSTLCTALAGHYEAAGQAVDHFREEEILSRPEFSRVAAEFGDGSGSVAPQTLIDGFTRYVDRSVADDIDLVITDALFPFIPSLLVWGHSEAEIARVVAELEEASAALTVIMVLLAADPAVTLPRAVEREGPGWIDGYIKKLSKGSGTSHVVNLSTAIDQLRREADVTRRLINQDRWTLVEVDATASAHAMTALVKRRLDAVLTGSAPAES
jgi:thymidylate kinase